MFGSTLVRIEAADFDVGREYARLCDSDSEAGAVAFFVGRVRCQNEEQQVAELELEHYPGMTEKLIGQICDQARQRWSVRDISLVHRVGKLHPGEQIVFVGVSAAHRGDAIDAMHFIMDYLKTEATFWKKETRGTQTIWLEQRDADREARKKWS